VVLTGRVLSFHGIDSTGALGTLDDLWQFTPSTGLWTWTSGAVTATGT
jgi:hypothetical protein